VACATPPAAGETNSRLGTYPWEDESGFGHDGLQGAVGTQWHRGCAEVSYTNLIVSPQLDWFNRRILRVMEQLSEWFDGTTIRTAVGHLSQIFYADGITEVALFALEIRFMPTAIQQPSWLGGGIRITHNWPLWPAASSKENFV